MLERIIFGSLVLSFGVAIMAIVIAYILINNEHKKNNPKN